MQGAFEMGMMGEWTFFLGLQIKQTKECTFIHQEKYTEESIKKFEMENSKAVITSISTSTYLDADENGK